MPRFVISGWQYWTAKYLSRNCPPSMLYAALVMAANNTGNEYLTNQLTAMDQDIIDQIQEYMDSEMGVIEKDCIENQSLEQAAARCRLVAAEFLRAMGAEELEATQCIAVAPEESQ